MEGGSETAGLFIVASFGVTVHQTHLGGCVGGRGESPYRRLASLRAGRPRQTRLDAG